MTAEPEEAELVRRVRRGDTAAFDLLVNRYLKRAFAVAYRLLGHREDAEDLVQEAFIAAVEKIDTFQEGRLFGPWFFRILVNRGLNARKARAIRRTEQIGPDVPAHDPSPLRAMERAEVREQLGTALAALPDRQQTIVRLFELEGFSGVEIAEILGISDGTVRWHLHQARRVLREAMEHFAGRNA